MGHSGFGTTFFFHNPYAQKGAIFSLFGSDFRDLGCYTYAMQEREKPYMPAVEAIRTRYLAGEFRGADPMFDLVVSELLRQVDNLRMGVQDFRDQVALKFMTSPGYAGELPKASYERAEAFIAYGQELKAKEARMEEDRRVCLSPVDSAESFGVKEEG